MGFNRINTALIKHCAAGLLQRVSSFSSSGRGFTVLALALVIALGTAFRLEDLDHWQRAPERAFVGTEPLHTTFDAWFYLSLAQDLADGSYDPIDARRAVPDGSPRPFPPPLISILAAGIARLTPFSISWIGAVLPAVLGPLLAVPLYLLGRFYGGHITGLTAALVAVLYPLFIYRSNIGRFDTDCLNVTWAAAAAYLFLRFGTDTTGRRYGYFAGGLAVYALFWWWWDQAPGAVALITFVPLAIALALFYRPSRREAGAFSAILACAVAVFLVAAGPGAPLEALRMAWLNYVYITGGGGGEFPRIDMTISEQVKPTLGQLIDYTTNNVLTFTVGVAGLVLLFWRRFRPALFLASFVALSAGAFLANRFVIFVIPLIAIGTAYAVAGLWHLRPAVAEAAGAAVSGSFLAVRFMASYVLCPLLLVLLVWPLFRANEAYVQWPVEPGPIAGGMVAARNLTPPDAVVWAWWDHGYALNFLARRATVDDGSIHGGERTVYAALPLAVESYRAAANFMHFYVIRGTAGIAEWYDAAGGAATGLGLLKAILGAGPVQGRAVIERAKLKPIGGRGTADDWLEFLFPRQRRPVYLFLDDLLTRTAHWWYWFGSWDVAARDGHHAAYKRFLDVHEDQGRLVAPGGLDLDLGTGRLAIPEGVVRLRRLRIHDRDGFEDRTYDPAGAYGFEYLKAARFGALMDMRVAESVFNRLYMGNAHPARYFRPLILRTPYYQLWEVAGDTLPDR